MGRQSVCELLVVELVKMLFLSSFQSVMKTPSQAKVKKVQLSGNEIWMKLKRLIIRTGSGSNYPPFIKKI